jgi:hypothetical protein
MMEIYIPTRMAMARFHTAPLLKAAGVKFTLVVDNEEQRAAAHKLGYKRTMLTPNVADLAAKRTAINQQHGKGFYISMDDNIQEFQAVMPKYMKQKDLDTGNTAFAWRKVFNQRIAPADMVDALGDLSEMCVHHGTVYGGVATMENPFFRGGERYAYRRFVKGKIFVMEADPQLEFKYSMVEDSYMTAQVLAMYGSVVVDKRLFYRARWYEPGGHGTREQREANGLMDHLRSICAEYPGLVGVGKGGNTALRVLRTSENGINKWREENGYL